MSNDPLSCRLSNTHEMVVYWTYLGGGSTCLSNQHLTTRGRPVTKCYASLIAITRFHVTIKRVYARLFPYTNNNALRGSIVAWHLLCELRRQRERAVMSLDSEFPWQIFHLLHFILRRRKIRKIYGSDLHLIIEFNFFSLSCDNRYRDYRQILTNSLLSNRSDYPSNNV